MSQLGVIKDTFTTVSFADESIPSESIITELSGLAYLQPGFSGRGPDNRIIELNYAGKFDALFGDDYDNIDQYGMTGIMARRGLSGGARVFFCNLTAENARYANGVFKVLVRQATVTIYQRNSFGGFDLNQEGNKIPLGTDNGLEIKTVFEPVADISDASNDVLETVAADDGGANWVSFPLALFSYNGKGSGGNSIGLTLDLDGDRDGEVSDGRRYVLNVIQKTSSGAVTTVSSEPIYFAFNPEAQFSPDVSQSEALDIVFPKDKFNDRDRLFDVNLKYYTANYLSLIEYLDNGYEIVDPTMIDFVKGVNTDGYAYDRIVMNDETIDVDSETLFLQGGDDGDLDETIAGSFEAVEATREQLLIDFYSGMVDSDLLDEKFVDAHLTFNADFTLNVRKTMHSTLRAIRPDIIVFDDLGVTRSASEARGQYAGIRGTIDRTTYGWGSIITPLCGMTNDRERQIEVGGAYEAIYGLPISWKKYGDFTVYAGVKNGTINTIDPFWYPRKTIDGSDFQIMKECQFYYATKVSKTPEFAFMSDDTQYASTTSRINSLRNALVISDAIKASKQILINYVYDSDGAEVSMVNAKNDIDDLLGSGRYPDNIVVVPRIYQSTQDKKTDNATCELVLQLPGILKTWSIDIKARRAE